MTQAALDAGAVAVVAPEVPAPEPAAIADPPGPPGDTAIGTSAPTVLIDTAPDGHWVAYCQARADTDDKPGVKVSLGRHGGLYGDAMVPYLAIGASEELRLASFVGRDDSGRFVVATLDDHAMVLIDTWAGEQRVLEGAQTDDDASAFGTHRAAAFHGEHLAYAKDAADDKTEVVVRNLLSGIERTVHPGDGKLWRFEFGATGQRLIVRTLREDTDGDGVISPPIPNSSLAGRHCRGPVGSYSTFDRTGDEASVGVVDIRQGAVAKDVPGAITVMTSGPLVRKSDGALVLVAQDGEHMLLDASCRARVVHVQPERDEVWAACRSAGIRKPDHHFGRAPLLRVVGGKASEVGLSVELYERDRLKQPHGLLIGIDGDELQTINTATGSRGKTLPMGYPAAVRGDRLLFLSDRAVVQDLATGGLHRIRGLDPGFIYVAEGSMVAVLTGRRTTVVDFTTERVLGKTKAEAIAVAKTGHVLVPRRSNGAVARLPLGPLRWYAPK